MNIDYRVRNSIYCTPASRALSAAQLLNGPSHARLTHTTHHTMASSEGSATVTSNAVLAPNFHSVAPFATFEPFVRLPAKLQLQVIKHA
jgi:hypothetical protein